MISSLSHTRTDACPVCDPLHTGNHVYVKTDGDSKMLKGKSDGSQPTAFV